MGQVVRVRAPSLENPRRQLDTKLRNLCKLRFCLIKSCKLGLQRAKLCNLGFCCAKLCKLWFCCAKLCKLCVSILSCSTHRFIEVSPLVSSSTSAPIHPPSVCAHVCNCCSSWPMNPVFWQFEGRSSIRIYELPERDRLWTSSISVCNPAISEVCSSSKMLKPQATGTTTLLKPQPNESSQNVRRTRDYIRSFVSMSSRRLWRGSRIASSAKSRLTKCARNSVAHSRIS